MADLINLRQARKRKRRAEKESAAAANRHAHGRSASEWKETSLARALEERRLEGHRREGSGPVED
jgi:hypothetical protein